MDNQIARDLAYQLTMCMQAYIECEGMKAENQHRLSLGQSIAYGEEAFNNVIEKHGIHHNAVLSKFNY